MSLVRISHPSLADLATTEVSASIAASDGTLTVVNANPFSANQYLLLESYENSQAEIVRASSATPSGTSIALDSSNEPAFAHTSNTIVQFIPYNQVAIEYSDDFETNWDSGAYTTLSAASTASTWTALVTTDIQPSQKQTVYDDTAASDRSYRTRFYNEQANIYSPYSSPILPDGFEGESVGSVIERALKRTGQDIDDGDNSLITYDFCIEALNEGIRELHYERKRWSWNSNYEASLGDITAGTHNYGLPADIDDTNTSKSVYNIRIDNRANLRYVDKRELDRLLRNSTFSDLAGALTSGSGTIVLDDTSNFDDSGTFTIITDTTKDTVTYTANNRATNTLTLSAAATEVTVTHAIDTKAWQGASFGIPTSYTTYEDTVIFYPIPDTTVDARVINIDYYKKVTEVDGQDDYLLFPDTTILVYYLCMAISDRLKEYEDVAIFERRYEDRKRKLIRNEYDGKKRAFSLVLNTGGNPMRNGMGTSIGRANNEGNATY